MAYLHLPTELNGVIDTPDVNATICCASWVVYNSVRDSLILSFEQDGALTISKNGDVSTAHWKYDKEENEFRVFYDTRRCTLKLNFLDDDIMVLSHPIISEKKNGAWSSLKDSDVKQELEALLGSCDGFSRKLYGDHIYMIADSQQSNISECSLECVKQHLENKAIAETIVNEVFKQQWNRYNKTTSAIIITEFIFLILISGCITNLVYRIVPAYLIDRYLLAEMGTEILAGSILLLIALMCYQIYKRADIKMKERMKKKKIEFRQFLKHTLR